MKKTASFFIWIKKRPFELLGLVGFLAIIVSFLPVKQSSTLDINLHDTYFVVSNVTVYQLFGAFFLFNWSLYLLLNRYLLNISLTWIHIIGVLVPFAAFFALPFIHTSNQAIPRKYYSFSEFERMKSNLDLIRITYVSFFLMFCLGQIVWFINILGGIVKRFIK